MIGIYHRYIYHSKFTFQSCRNVSKKYTIPKVLWILLSKMALFSHNIIYTLC